MNVKVENVLIFTQTIRVALGFLYSVFVDFS